MSIENKIQGHKEVYGLSQSDVKGGRAKWRRGGLRKDRKPHQ